MHKKVILGGIMGGLTTLLFSLGSLLLFNRFSLNSLYTPDNLLLNLVTMLISPFAGGFLAGLIGQSSPKRAGLLAGLGASLIIIIAWVVISGLSWSAILNGLIVGFVWVVLSRIGAGISSKGDPIIRGS
jgi:hypothetical protein